VTTTISDDEAVRVTELPLTVARAVGAVSTTDGEVVSVAAVLVLQDAVLPSALATVRIAVRVEPLLKRENVGPDIPELMVLDERRRRGRRGCKRRQQ
jgi:hypothetical protein